MGKRWRKQKAGAQEPRKRRPMHGPGSATGAGGALGGMRRMTRGFFGSSAPASGAAKLLDRLLWIAVAFIAVLIVSRRC
jgi:hypothetical protein